eukprot:gene7308-426_t
MLFAFSAALQMELMWKELMEHMWKEVISQFLDENPKLGLRADKEGKKLYMWATAVVSSYSFMLGDDKYQVCR